MAVRQCYVSTRWQSASVGAGPFLRPCGSKRAELERPSCARLPVAFVPARWLDRASVRENGYVSTRWQSASVGAGPVPARWPLRATGRRNARRQCPPPM